MAFGINSAPDSYFACFMIGTIPVVLAISCYRRGSPANTREEAKQRLIESAAVGIITTPLLLLTIPVALIGAVYTTGEVAASVAKHGISHNKFFKSVYQQEIQRQQQIETGNQNVTP